MRYALMLLLLGVGVQADAARCGSLAVTLEQAKAFVLAAPNIRAAVRLRHAKPLFESIEKTPLGWRFTVNSATPCEGDVKACSKLLGHYSVGRNDGRVYDLDDVDGDGKLVSSAEMQRLRAGLRPKMCGGQHS